MSRDLLWDVRLAAGDAVILLAFAMIGRASHHELGTSSQVAAIGTAAPFLLGWFLVAPRLGGFAPRAVHGQRTALLTVAIAWPPALLLSLVLRAVLEGRIPPASFAVVALLFNGIALAAWRALFATARRRGIRRPPR